MENSKNKALQKAIDQLKGKTKLFPAQYYVDGILKGDISILSQAITLLESKSNDHRELADQLIRECLPHSGKAIRVGITGVPGVGKSTFIEAIGTYILENTDSKLAVLAIDPSSPISGGSILGDKTRMEKLSMDNRAFIRPSPSSESLGGVARKTRETMILCEAAGYNVIFIETVGVGQSETAVHQMTDFFLLLMLAGAGDQLQGIKRGIMEMCDALFITKADGDNKMNATRAKAEYTSALHFYPPKPSGWVPVVDICSSLDETGIDNVWNQIMKHHNWLSERGQLEVLRNQQDLDWMNDTLKERVLNAFFNSPEYLQKVVKIKDDLLQKKMTPFQAADLLFQAKKN
ncbi:MAG: methylmalonyl Co-A mutase-associated GTPase MeaB [Flavobacteriales bacterium]